MAEFNAKKDYYRILRVDEDATAEEITRTFRQEAVKRHPDRGGNEEDMKALNEAYTVLSDTETRRAYDAKRGIDSAREERRHTDHDGRRPTTPGLNIESVAERAGGDFFGLLVGALVCLGIGVPLLLIIEIQWVFFLWPLRILAVGIVLIGLFLSRAAFKFKYREMMSGRAGQSRVQWIASDVIFWLFFSVLAFMFYLILEAVAR
jgi:hypothetical protein